VDDVQAALRERILVPNASGALKIRSYRGKGPLKTWLRISAMHLARNLYRDRAGRKGNPALPVESKPRDPEVELAKSEYAAEFKAAFQNTIAHLSASDRSLLRFHYLDGMTVRTLARLFGIHPATAARRVERVRHEILRETNRLLMSRLQLERAEVHGLVGLIESQLELSIRRCLEDGRSRRDPDSNGSR
jgi:RNA polymerase sigma-70 factor (ECF subfamily)